MSIKAASQLSDHELALLAASGFERLWRDIHSSETLLDVAARSLERISSPGHDRGLDWFDTAVRNGCTDEAQS